MELMILLSVIIAVISLFIMISLVYSSNLLFLLACLLIYLVFNCHLQLLLATAVLVAAAELLSKQEVYMLKMTHVMFCLCILNMYVKNQTTYAVRALDLNTTVPGKKKKLQTKRSLRSRSFSGLLHHVNTFCLRLLT